MKTVSQAARATYTNVRDSGTMNGIFVACASPKVDAEYPFFEGGSVIEVEPLQEIAPQHPCFQVRLLPGAGQKAQCVNLQQGVVQRDRLAPRQQSFSAQRTPEASYGLVQRVPRVLLRFLGPQQPHEMVAAAGAIRGAGEVDEQSKVFAPQNLGGGISALQSRRGWPETEELESWWA